MRFPTAAVFVCAQIGASFAQAADAPPSDEASVSTRVDGFVSRVMKRHHIQGAAIAVIRDGKATTRAYGLANVEWNAPATEDSVYQIASMTKPFTATAVMLLIKEGRLSLDDKITERLPDLPKSWDKVTVRQLLTHTSGIKSYTSVDGFSKTQRIDRTPRELVDLVANAPTEFAPGEKASYCNTGFVLLGMLIEKTAGKPYGAFVAERIFSPLGMTRTRANDLDAVIPGRVQGYRWEGATLRNAEYVSPTQPFSAGMLVSTVADLVKWDAALRDHAILDESTLERMWTNTALNDGKKSGFGLGWEVSTVNNHRLISHSGAIAGFSTEIARFVDDRLTVIVLVNADGGRARSLSRGIAALHLPPLADKPAEPIADPDPKTTERLEILIRGMRKGEFDDALFSEREQKRAVPAIRADKARLASFGALKTFQLLEREDKNQRLRLRYRAVLENMTVTLTFELDKAGKIDGIGMHIED